MAQIADHLLLDLALRTTRIVVDFPGEVTAEVFSRPGDPTLIEIYVDRSDLEKAEALKIGLHATLEGAAGCTVDLRIGVRGGLPVSKDDDTAFELLGVALNLGGPFGRTPDGDDDDVEDTSDDCPNMQDTGCTLGTACT